MNTGKLTCLLAIATAMIALGCAPKNRGAPGSYRTESRLPSEGTNPGSRDLTTATERAVEKIAAVPAIRKSEGKTVIVMDRVVNKTSDPSADFQIYLARIRALMNQSGMKKDLVFVENRNKAEQIKAREGIPPKETGRTRPDYALTGTFYDMPRGRTNYHLLTFQLVNLSNDQIAWEGSYEVKL